MSPRAALLSADALHRIFGAEGLRDREFLARWEKCPRGYLAAYRETEARWAVRVGSEAARRVLPRVFRKAVRHQISPDEALRNLALTPGTPAEFRRVLFRLDTLSDAVRFRKKHTARRTPFFSFSSDFEAQ